MVGGQARLTRRQTVPLPIEGLLRYQLQLRTRQAKGPEIMPFKLKLAAASVLAVSAFAQAAAKAVIGASASVDAKDGNDATLLHFAAARGHEAVVAMLGIALDAKRKAQV